MFVLKINNSIIAPAITPIVATPAGLIFHLLIQGVVMKTAKFFTPLFLLKGRSTDKIKAKCHRSKGELKARRSHHWEDMIKI